MAKGPVWTGRTSKPWLARDISYAASRALRFAGVPWYRHPYKLKKLTATALVAAGGSWVDVAKFIRHNPSSGNLDRYYVDNDLGRSVADKLDEITAAI